MKRVISTALAFVLLLGLGALAVLALPGAQATLAPTNVAAAPVSFQSAAAPDAPLATSYNMIALPLDSSAQFTYDADGLLAFVGSSAVQVLSWDPVSQGYLFRYSDGFGDPFPLVTGGAYWLEVNSDAPAVVSFVGDVPAQGSISFNFVGDSSSCKWNQFSVPLDRSDITTADELLAAIGDAEQVVSWDAASQGYLFRYSDGFGDLFPVKIGYPYGVCMLVSKTWPQ